MMLPRVVLARVWGPAQSRPYCKRVSKVQTAFSCQPGTFGLKVQEVPGCCVVFRVVSYSEHPAFTRPAGVPSGMLHP